MKKSISIFLCVMILFGSFALASAAESTETHVSGCECAECAGEKDLSDITYVPPSVGETTTKRDILDDVVSKYIGDELSEAGKDFDKHMTFAEKIVQFFHDICKKLADFAQRLADPIRNLIKR